MRPPLRVREALESSYVDRRKHRFAFQSNRGAAALDPAQSLRNRLPPPVLVSREGETSSARPTKIAGPLPQLRKLITGSCAGTDVISGAESTADSSLAPLLDRHVGLITSRNLRARRARHPLSLTSPPAAANVVGEFRPPVAGEIQFAPTPSRYSLGALSCFFFSPLGSVR